MNRFLSLILLLASGCAPESGPKADPAASTPDGTAVMADATAQGDAARASSTEDAGRGPQDSAVRVDASREPDASPVADAGPVPDAALSIDVGALPDAESSADAGGDSADAADAAVNPDAALAPGRAILSNPGPELAILFVGNSYTNSNRLDQAVCELAAQTGRFDSVRCEKVTAGGYRLTQHAADAQNGGRLAMLLAADNPQGPRWDAVVLQEQSQIPGFPVMQADHVRFRQGVVTLNARIAAMGAETALLMTWGRRDGDGQNAGLYPDYLTMQERLEAGYTAAAEAASTRERTVHVLPVGVGWRSTHLRDAAGDFRALYSGDGSHPALPGTYLSALIILDHLVGVDLAELVPLDRGPEAALAARLRQDAATVARD